MTTSTLLWTAPTGEHLTFHPYPRYGEWLDKPGLYMFCRPGGVILPWTPLYIGKADNLKDRLCGHERWDEAAKLGASHVLAVGVALASNRTRFEDALIKHFNPKLNVLLKPENSLAAGLSLYRKSAPAPTILGAATQGLRLGATLPAIKPVPTTILGAAIGGIKRK